MCSGIIYRQCCVTNQGTPKPPPPTSKTTTTTKKPNGDCFLTDKILEVKNNKQLFGVSSANECQSKCQQEPMCMVFEFVSTGQSKGHCNSKQGDIKHVTNSYHAGTVITGTKYCDCFLTD